MTLSPLIEAPIFSPSFLAYPSQSYTLLSHQRQIGETVSPKCSIWGSTKSEIPNTSCPGSRKDINAFTKCFARQGNAQFLRLHIWSFQGNGQVPGGICQEDEFDVDPQRQTRLDATTCCFLCIDFQEHRCRYICRKINLRGVFRTIDPPWPLANWDGGGAASGAGSGTGSGAGSGTGSGASSGAGTIRMVGIVATVATPPTPAWT